MSGRGRRDEGSYDRMQVCLNGHRVTASVEDFPQFRKEFCSECGAKTITCCPECNAPIPGHLRGVLTIHEPPVPNNCHGCGTAYPWRQQALSAAVDIFNLEMDEQDAAAAQALIADISTDSPRTELAAYKLGKLLAKLRKPAYDITIKIVADILSASAKKQLGMTP